MIGRMAALAGWQLRERRRAVLAWGLPTGAMAALIVAIFPSIKGALAKAVDSYPPGLREAFGIESLATVEQYLHAEMLSIIVPLAMGYLAARAMADALSGAAESGRLDALLAAPVRRAWIVVAGFAAAAIEVAAVLVLTWALTMLGSVASGAGLDAVVAARGYASVWPLAILFAAVGALVAGWSLRTGIVTGAAAGVLATMYVLDLAARLDPDLSWLGRLSAFHYYGNATANGIDTPGFVGTIVAALVIAALAAWRFERRDLPA